LVKRKQNRQNGKSFQEAFDRAQQILTQKTAKKGRIFIKRYDNWRKYVTIVLCIAALKWAAPQSSLLYKHFEFNLTH
jgi:hypothetical protein